jgi:hypothetical protein
MERILEINSLRQVNQSRLLKVRFEGLVIGQSQENPDAAG